jgi:hypothetical protein
MALDVAHGYFKTGTTGGGTIIPITGVGFQPKAVLFVYNGRTEIVDATSLQSHRRGIGFANGNLNDVAVGSSSEQSATPVDSYHDMYATRCVEMITDAGGLAAELRIDAVNADGFDMEVPSGAPALDYTVEWYAFGGTDITQFSLTSFIEPFVAGVLNVDGIGFAPDVCFYLTNASGGEGVGITGDSRMQFGVTTFANSAIQNATWGGGSNDGANPSNTSSYCRSGECIGVMSTDLTAVNSRARVTAKRTLGIEMTYDEVSGGGNRETYVLAIKGGQWALRNFTSSVDLANKVVSDLGFDLAPKGGIVFSACHTESTVNIADTGDEWSMGWFTSTSDRAVMAVEEVDNVVTADVQSAYEKDNVYIGCNAVGGIDARIDINAIAVNSLTFSQSLMDFDSRFVNVLTFSDNNPFPPIPEYRNPMITTLRRM